MFCELPLDLVSGLGLGSFLDLVAEDLVDWFSSVGWYGLVFVVVVVGVVCWLLLVLWGVLVIWFVVLWCLVVVCALGWGLLVVL